jgi:rRNA small subunit pseudouridine methyltransferase Nep1
MQGFELLNCDEHVGLQRKMNRDPAASRPDITHQLLLALLDSPLNKAGMLQIFIETTKNVLIEVSPATRIPRTFKRFAGLMGTSCTYPYPPSRSFLTFQLTRLSFHAAAVQLLHKMKVRAADSSETLLKVIRNPITDHLPVGAPIFGLEAGARLVDPLELPALVPNGKPVVFVVGAMSHGDIDADFIQATYCISRFPLSAACSVGKLLNAFEHAWGVL